MRPLLYAALMMAALGGGLAQAQSSNQGMMMDPYAYHPQRLTPGTAEYDYVMQMRAKTATQMDEATLNRALEACARIAPLSQATRDKCEVKARQTAVKPAP